MVASEYMLSLSGKFRTGIGVPNESGAQRPMALFLRPKLLWRAARGSFGAAGVLTPGTPTRVVRLLQLALKRGGFLGLSGVQS